MAWSIASAGLNEEYEAPFEFDGVVGAELIGVEFGDMSNVVIIFVREFRL